jgi:DNA modification methylase
VADPDREAVRAAWADPHRRNQMLAANRKGAPVTEPAALDVLQLTAEDLQPPALTVPLAQRYGFPPFTVIDRRGGEWQKRKRRWNKLGLDSGKGRSEELLAGFARLHQMSPDQYATLKATSIFDPALCELAYDWFSPPGGHVLDPFAGGSVRGLVASRLGRRYTGIDLNREQIEANIAQMEIGDPGWPIRWINGDSNAVLDELWLENGGGEWADFIFSCPPYFDLEQYSDGPADLSGMTYDQFIQVYGEIIIKAGANLRPDRFAGWVISDVRDERGRYRGLVKDTIQCFQDAGLHLYNEIILVDPVGSTAIRAARPFDGSRKVARLHQNFLVFVKGDPRAASADLNCAIEASEAPIADGTPALF